MISWRTFYNVHNARAALYNISSHQWEASVAVPNLQGISFTPTHDTDQARVMGANEKLLSVLIGVEATLDFVGRDDALMTALSGTVSSSSGSGVSETRLTRHKGGRNLAYFGLIVQIMAEDDGDEHLLLPFGKLQQLPGLEMTDENAFSVPDITANFARLRLPDNSTYDIYAGLEHATCAPIEEDFNLAFAPLITTGGGC